MMHVMRWVAVMVLVAMQAACGGEAPPERIAIEYWQAVRDADVRTVRDLTVSTERDWVQDDWPGLPQLAGAEVDPVQSQAEELRLPTRLLLQDENGQPWDAPLRMETLLVREGDAWRVRNQATMAQFAGAMAAYSLRMAGEALRRGMEETGTALQEGMRAFQQGLQEGAPVEQPADQTDAQSADAADDAQLMEEALQQNLDAMARQMEEAAEEMMRAMEQMSTEAEPESDQPATQQ